MHAAQPPSGRPEDAHRAPGLREQPAAPAGPRRPARARITSRLAPPAIKRKMARALSSARRVSVMRATGGLPRPAGTGRSSVGRRSARRPGRGRRGSARRCGRPRPCPASPRRRACSGRDAPRPRSGRRPQRQEVRPRPARARSSRSRTSRALESGRAGAHAALVGQGDDDPGPVDAARRAGGRRPGPASGRRWRPGRRGRGCASAVDQRGRDAVGGGVGQGGGVWKGFDHACLHNARRQAPRRRMAHRRISRRRMEPRRARRRVLHPDASAGVQATRSRSASVRSSLMQYRPGRPPL